MPYGHQSYPDPPVSIAYNTSIEQPASSSVPFLYPLPCHKFGYYTATSVTPTVITHTASTMGAQGSVHQAHGYPHTGDTYPEAPCRSLSFMAAVSDPVHTALPSVTAAHCFSVPEQVAVTGVRGKHKQKTGGVRTAGPSVAPSGLASTAPTPTSCLAKLLSSGPRERESLLSFVLCLTTVIHVKKWVGSCFCPILVSALSGKPSLRFDTTLVTAKGQRSSSPSSLVSLSFSITRAQVHLHKWMAQHLK